MNRNDVTRYVDCIKKLTSDKPDMAYFLATDNLPTKNYFVQEFGKRLFTMDVLPVGPTSVEFQHNKKQDAKLTGELGT